MDPSLQATPTDELDSRAERGRESSRSSTRRCEEALVLAAAIRELLAFEDESRSLVRWIVVRTAERSLSVEMRLI